MAESHSTKRVVRRYTDEQKQEMVRRYESGETTPQIAKAMNCPIPSVWFVLRRFGVKLRPSGPKPLPPEILKKRKLAYQKRWRATPEGQAFTKEATRKSRQNPKVKVQRAKAARRYQQRYPEKVSAAKRKARWQSRHGITEEQYETMFAAQDGKCAICKTTKPGGQKMTTRLSVDHDHGDGRIRGLLCFKCNTILGQLGDTKESIEAWYKVVVLYLTK